jgi:large subunit ribosomal protein L4
MIQLALRSALSDRAAQGRVALIDAWTFDVPSTKAAVRALGALGLSGRVLVVLGDEDGFADRSFANLPEIQTMVVGELNAYDVLCNDWVVFTDATLPGGAGASDAPESADAVDIEAAAEAGPAAEDETAGAADDEGEES